MKLKMPKPTLEVPAEINGDEIERYRTRLSVVEEDDVLSILFNSDDGNVAQWIELNEVNAKQLAKFILAQYE